MARDQIVSVIITTKNEEKGIGRLVESVRKQTYKQAEIIIVDNYSTDKTIEIAKKNLNLNPDIEFIKNATMLHDIGIVLTDAPKIGCFGEHQYICHGYLGREILEKEGFAEYALVCERHIGVGITIEDIKKQKLPLPERDMIPITIEEKIICVADKFFSKNEKYLKSPKPLELIYSDLEKLGNNKVEIFKNMLKEFQMI